MSFASPEMLAFPNYAAWGSSIIGPAAHPANSGQRHFVITGVETLSRYRTWTLNRKKLHCEVQLAYTVYVSEDTEK